MNFIQRNPGDPKHGEFHDGEYEYWPTEGSLNTKSISLPAAVVNGLELLAAAVATGLLALALSTLYIASSPRMIGEHYAVINALLEDALQRKEQSNIALAQRLREQGLPLDYWTVKAATPGGNVNRAVIAAYLVNNGFCGSVKEAFDRWLAPELGFYVPPKRPDAFEVIRFIKSIGAVAVLAHPLLTLEEDRLRIFLDRAAPLGLDGMETIYSTYDKATQLLAGAIADAYGLLHSGGSDFHGSNKPDIVLGFGRGNVAVPVELAYRLQERSR